MLRSPGIKASSDFVPRFQLYLWARHHPQLKTLGINTQTGGAAVPWQRNIRRQAREKSAHRPLPLPISRGSDGVARLVGLRQFTVSVKVVVWESEPDEAVTVTVCVFGRGVGPPPPQLLTQPPPPPPPPPQLVSSPRPATPNTTRRSIWRRRRFLKPKQQSATANADAGKSGLGLRCTAAVTGAVAVTMSFVATSPPDGVTVAGEKLHVASVGSPEHLNETVPLNPFTGVTGSEIEANCPAGSVSSGKVAGTEKSGMKVKLAVATALLR